MSVENSIISERKSAIRFLAGVEDPTDRSEDVVFLRQFVVSGCETFEEFLATGLVASEPEGIGVFAMLECQSPGIFEGVEEL